MELQEVKDIIESFDKSGSCFLEFSQGDMKIKLKKQVASQQMKTYEEPTKVIAKQVTDVTDNLKTVVEEDGEIVKAPLVGVFYASPSPEQKAFVQVGSKVQKGQVLCFIEAMKMMSEITAPIDGVIREIFVKNQDVVEFETPLFRIGD